MQALSSAPRTALPSGPLRLTHARSVVARGLFDNNDPFSGLRSIQGDVDAIQQRALGEQANAQQTIERAGKEVEGIGARLNSQFSGGSTSYYTSVGTPSTLPRLDPATPAPTSTVLPIILVGIIVATTYSVGQRFKKGFAITKYKQDNLAQMSFMWPFLLIFNSEFRGEFARAIKYKEGSDVEKQLRDIKGDE